MLVSGDFNVIPEDIECHKRPSWMYDALFQPAEPREPYRAYPGMLEAGEMISVLLDRATRRRKNTIKCQIFARLKSRVDSNEFERRRSFGLHENS